MVVFREDIIEKMCRNSIEMTSDKKEVAKDVSADVHVG
jgi:hypothetical protein